MVGSDPQCGVQPQTLSFCFYTPTSYQHLAMPCRNPPPLHMEASLPMSSRGWGEVGVGGSPSHGKCRHVLTSAWHLHYTLIVRPPKSGSRAFWRGPHRTPARLTPKRPLAGLSKCPPGWGICHGTPGHLGSPCVPMSCPHGKGWLPVGATTTSMVLESGGRRASSGQGGGRSRISAVTIQYGSLDVHAMWASIWAQDRVLGSRSG